jgi:hypothetical protein
MKARQARAPVPNRRSCRNDRGPEAFPRKRFHTYVTTARIDKHQSRASRDHGETTRQLVLAQGAAAPRPYVAASPVRTRDGLNPLTIR